MNSISELRPVMNKLLKDKGKLKIFMILCKNFGKFCNDYLKKQYLPLSLLIYSKYF